MRHAPSSPPLIPPVWRWLALSFQLAVLTPGALFPPRTAASTVEHWLQKTWLTEDGLPTDSITTLTRTSDGFLWIGTPRGIARFDGVRFHMQRDLHTGPPRNFRITAMTADANGQLWVAADNGALVRLSPDGSGHSVTLRLSLPRPALNLTADAAGQIWCGYSGGWSRLKADGTVAETQFPSEADPETPCAFFRRPNGEMIRWMGGVLARMDPSGFTPLTKLDAEFRLAPRNAGGFWITYAHQLGIWEPASGVSWLTDLRSAGPVETVNTLADDGRGGAWIGTLDSGLLHFDGRQVQRVSRLADDVTTLWLEPSGTMWFGTRDSGLHRVRRRAFQVSSVRTGLPKARASSVVMDSSNTLWVGYANAPLVRVQGSSVIGFAESSGAVPRNLHACSVAPDGSIWFAGEDRLLASWDGTAFKQHAAPEGVVRTLLPAADGSLWTGSFTHGVNRWRRGDWIHYRARDGAPAKGVSAMAETTDRVVWIGQNDGKLTRYEHSRFQSFTPNDGAAPHPVSAILPRPDGSVWVASYGGGLLLWRRGEFRRFTVAHGLHSDHLVDLAADVQGRMWLASSHGLFNVRFEDLEKLAAGTLTRMECLNFGRDDGVSLPELIPSRTARTGAQRRIAFNGATGILQFSPEQVPVGRHDLQPVIERVRVDGRLAFGSEGTSRQFPRAIEFSPQANTIDLEFTAPELDSPERLRFACRVQGWETAWRELQEARRISYGRLPPGRYRFELRVRGTDGIWSAATAVLPFSIRPPFWRGAWFIGLAITGGAGSLVLGSWWISQRRVRQRIRDLQRREEINRERERIARDLHDDVGSSLTRLALLCDLTEQQADPKHTTRKIPEIARLARTTVAAMDEIVWTMNPANDSLPRLVGFLSRWIAEYLARTGVALEQDLPEELPDLPLSSEERHCVVMVVKEAVNNAIKHSGATTIHLTARCTEQTLNLTVVDNGRGFEPALQAVGHGLQNLRDRLAHLGGSTEIESSPSQGTTVRIILPLPNRTACEPP